MKIVGVIVARMTSSRLPGKPLLPLAGKTSLERHYERFALVKGIDDVYLATSRSPENRPLIDEALRLGMKVYQGSDEDIVERFVSVGEISGADALVRVGCDKPLFCYEILQNHVSRYRGEDYIYLHSGFTSGISHEILSLKGLQEVHRHYRGTAIAQYMREYPHKFHLRPMAADSIYYRPEYRLSLDTPEDYLLLKEIFEALTPKFDVIPTREALIYLDDNPESALINKAVVDKKVNTYSLKLEQEPVFQVFMNDDGKYLVLDRLKEPMDYDEFLKYVQLRDRWN